MELVKFHLTSTRTVLNPECEGLFRTQSPVHQCAGDGSHTNFAFQFPRELGSCDEWITIVVFGNKSHLGLAILRRKGWTGFLEEHFDVWVLRVGCSEESGNG